MDRPALISFFSELEKIAATVLMRKLSPKAKALMERMTGFGGKAADDVAPAAKGFLSPAKTRKSFSGSRKEVAQATEKLPGMTDADMAAQAVRGQAAGRRKQLDAFLQRTGRTSKPGVGKQLESIGGHPRQITRTPARVVEEAQLPKEIPGLSGAGTSVGTVAPRSRRPRPKIPAPASIPRTVTGFEPTVAL